MPKKAKFICKKTVKGITRVSGGIVIGGFFAPISTNGKMLSLTNEKIITDDFITAQDYLGLALLSPAIASIGLVYGIIRGAQLAKEQDNDNFLPRPKKIIKELFTYDPEFIKPKHIRMFTREEAKEYVDCTFVSLRKFDSEIFAKPRRGK